MTRFKIVANDYDSGTKDVKEFNAETLTDVVDQFSDFLRGVGFVFDDLTANVSPWEQTTDELDPNLLLEMEGGETTTSSFDNLVKFSKTE
tara:strand:- start:1542 stop:1811 length:270 start_codon:yes stop_codon:yes gene_type:complete